MISRRFLTLLSLGVLLSAGAYGQVRINCGSWPTSYVDSDGNTWQTDNYFTGGDAMYTSNATGLADRQLYLTARYGHYGNFSYAIPVANGTYQLVLKFAEQAVSEKGMRIFDVVVNGTPVLSAFDIIAETGAMYTPVDKTFSIVVTGGLAKIDFNGRLNKPVVSGIELLPAVAGPPTSITISPSSGSVQSGQTLQFSASSSATWGATAGSINAAGMFTAPTVSASTPVTITATSTADSSVKSQVTVTVTPPPSPTLTISPSSGSVQSGQTLQFSASISATWGATAGAINSAGMFTAPTVSASTPVTITATSAADSSVKSQVTVTVTPPPAPTLTISPPGGSVQSGQTLQFSASISATWGATAGAIDSAGLYTAPSVSASTPVTITATSTANSSLKAQVIISVTPVSAQTTSPIGWWTFDAAKLNGMSVIDSSTNAIDGTLVGGTLTAGVINEGFSFNGANTAVTFPTLDSYTDLNNDMTLAAWIKTLNNSRAEAIVARYNAAGAETGYVFRTSSTGHLELRIGGKSTFLTHAATLSDTGNPINDGQWHHVAVTISLGGGASFYVDGVLSSTQTLNIIPAISGSKLLIGMNGWTPYGTNFTGSMDDVRIYNRVLPASEIATLGNAPPPAPGTPALSISQSSLSFNAVLGGANPATQSVNIANLGGGTLTWTTSASQPWITVSPSSGTGPKTISVGAAIGALSSTGSYSGTLTISAAGSTPPTQTVNISLTITSVPVIPPGGNQHYASPSGSASGDGSIAKPWDLATVFAHPSAVKPGDTIWLRGGHYGNNNTLWTSKLTGTAAQPIILRQFPNERATISGNLAIWAPYTWYWGFEVAAQGQRSNLECIDTYPGSTGVKLINLVLHDCMQGIGFWVDAINAEAYGNLIYYIGLPGSTRGAGHAIYTQNNTGTKQIGDNIMFDGFDIGLQAYGSGAAYVQNYNLDGNVSFNNGVLYGSHVDNIIFAGGHGLNNLTINNSYTYHTPSLGAGYSRVGWGFGGGGTNLTMLNNYWIGGEQALQVWGFNGVKFTGNVAYSAAAVDLLLQPGSSPSSTYNWDNNAYYGTGLFQFNGSNLGFNSWKSAAHIDANSHFTSGRPTGVWTFVRPNKYESGRANIVIYNWDLKPTVDVDASSVLNPGDSYVVRDVFNFFGAPVASGIYSGSNISIPMTGLTVSAPVGSVPVPPKHTAPEFGTFILMKP